MHELSLMAGVFEIIEHKVVEHNLKQVTKVILKVGRLSCVQGSALKFAFTAFAQDTVAEGAELIVDWVEPVARCESCDAEFKVSFTNRVCPSCNRVTGNIIAGDELLLAQLEGE